MDYFCRNCGAKLELRDDHYKCLCCRGVFSIENIENYDKPVLDLLIKRDQERLYQYRNELFKELNKEHLSSKAILDWTNKIKEIVPNDFLANFYAIAHLDNSKVLNDFLDNIDTIKEYENIPFVIEFMLRTFTLDNLFSLNLLIERTYKNINNRLYEEYSTLLSNETEKLESGIYELNIPRDVFIAYSSKDIKIVQEVDRILNENGLSTFVALKNLRHGKGAVENYDKALETALDNTKIFLLISSKNSRSMTCDAFRKEIPYVKKMDLLRAPAQYAFDYAKLPNKYKKPRIELLIDEYKGVIAEKPIKEFFNGYEWVYSVENAAERALSILLNPIIEEDNKTIYVEKNIDNDLKGKSAKELYEYGLILQEKKEYEKALRVFQTGADLNHLQSIYKVGYFYWQGLGTPIDYKKAYDQFLRIAEDDYEACNMIGVLLYHGGNGLTKDVNKGLEYYKKAMDRGSKIAIGNYGEALCMEGRFKESLPYLIKAVSNGRISSEYYLGRTYENLNELEKAKNYYTLAARHGNRYAPKALEDLNKKLEENSAPKKEDTNLINEQNKTILVDDYKNKKEEKTPNQTLQEKMKENIIEDIEKQKENVGVDEHFLIEDGVLIRVVSNKVRIIVPDGVKVIKKHAFNNLQYAQIIELPKSVTKLEEEAIYQCHALKVIFIPSSVNDIKENSITEFDVTLIEIYTDGHKPRNLKALEKSYLRSDFSLDKMNKLFVNVYEEKANKDPNINRVRENTKYIEYLGTKDVNSLLKKKDNLTGKEAIQLGLYFEEGYLGNEIDLEKASSYYKYADTKCVCKTLEQALKRFEGLTYKKNTIIKGEGNTLYLAVPNGTSDIAKEAFKDNDKLAVIRLPNSMRQIGEYAFQNCSNLKAINIPESIQKLDPTIFSSIHQTWGINLYSTISKKEAKRRGWPKFNDSFVIYLLGCRESFILGELSRIAKKAIAKFYGKS